MEKNNTRSSLFSDFLKNKPFLEVLPWIGGDLQTLRDAFVIDFDKSKNNEKILFPINNESPSQIVIKLESIILLFIAKLRVCTLSQPAALV